MQPKPKRDSFIGYGTYRPLERTISDNDEKTQRISYHLLGWYCSRYLGYHRCLCHLGAAGNQARANFTRYRQRTARSEIVLWRLANRDAWSRASFPDRVFGGQRILWGQPEAQFLDTTTSSLRRAIWDRCLPLYVLGSDAALGLSQASILDFRNDHRGRHSYRVRRTSNISGCSPVLKPLGITPETPTSLGTD